MVKVILISFSLNIFEDFNFRWECCIRPGSINTYSNDPLLCSRGLRYDRDMNYYRVFQKKCTLFQSSTLIS